MNKILRITAGVLFASLFGLLSHFQGRACTSMIVSGTATASGRPIIWKHRDTSAESNFVHRVEKPGKTGYIGLFNGGDSLCLDEAWMGMNDLGFAIINTVAYNLRANSPEWTDREGYVMAQALETCRTVDDFAALLDSLPRPMGVRTNFGVLDADGNGAYFETDDYTYKRFDLSDAKEGVMIRTNYAYSGTPDEGMGYIRHKNVADILAPQIATASITPASLTEGVSRSFYNSLTGFDGNESSDSWAVDQDFVPRHSSTSSIAIEGILPGETPRAMIMWANIAYPPCCHVVGVTLDNVPAQVDATAQDGTARSPLAIEAAEYKCSVFPVERGSGPRYINLDAARQINEEQYQISLEEYSRGNELRKQAAKHKKTSNTK